MEHYKPRDTLPGGDVTREQVSHLSADGKYYYRSRDELAANSGPLPVPDAAVFGGLFEIGEPVGRGEFGAVHHLRKLFSLDYSTDKSEEVTGANYVLKISRQHIDLRPYIVRKELDDGTFLYIVRAMVARDFLSNCELAIRCLADRHNHEGRTHGDVNPGNLHCVDRNYAHSFARTQPTCRLIEEFGWEGVREAGTGRGLARDLIDPDISCEFGELKRVSRVLHEDPRCETAGPLDDLIGVLNTVMLECGVSVTRDGGFAYDDSCDFRYSCTGPAASAVWQRIGMYYTNWRPAEDEGSPRNFKETVGLFREFKASLSHLRSVAGKGETVMSSVLRSSTIDFSNAAAWPT